VSVEIIKFGNIPEAVQEGSGKAILELVTRVTAQAKALAPVDKGQLRNSIMGRTQLEDIGFNDGSGERAPLKILEKANAGQGLVGTAVLHGIYQEFGTRFTRAQPYLRPAVDIEANGTKAKTAVLKAQNDSVKKEARSGRRTKRTVG